MLEKGTPVRVELLDKKSYAGLIEADTEDEILLHCIYKFVEPSDQDGASDKVLEALADYPGRTLLMIANETGTLRQSITGWLIRSEPKNFIRMYREFRKGDADVWMSLVAGWEAYTREQKKGLCSVISSAMLEQMSPVLVAQQSPVDMIIPKHSIHLITSLVDEGQEQFFERLANG